MMLPTLKIAIVIAFIVTFDTVKRAHQNERATFKRVTDLFGMTARVTGVIGINDRQGATKRSRQV